MPVNGELRHRIERALARFSPSWEGRDAARRAVALKMLILCELAGGRLRVVDALGLNDNTLDNYRHGKTEPRHSTLNMMAELAEVPIEYLGNDWSVEDGVIHFSTPEIPSAGFSEPSPIWDVADRIVIPAYEDLGSGQSSLERHDITWAAIPRGFWAILSVDPENMRVVSASGDSMSPTILDGAPMFVDIGDRKLEDGSVYLFDVGEELIARRVQRLVDGSLELLPDNLERYRPQHVLKDGLRELKVVGRVCAASRIL
ncbi:transcriptional regulator with XRE-family HTH domain [Neorhizobium galegae]|uniref:S24 family peptidase n=1 Tax=Neorhizobium galegae TaxID=399 RepID=UPI001AE410CA|nr:S24 family peptidase [Neorhizobium galegae]MBP2560322.1 transcriptional regulator with XRE-family HTH domain [Neorhizobium galegae]